MTLIMERMAYEYRKTTKVNNLLYASNARNGDIVVEPYNAVLSTQCLMEHSEAILTSTNSGLSNYC